MSRKTRSLIKGIAVVLAGLSILAHMDILMIDFLKIYDYWLLVISFGLILLVSR
ncbi:MAG: hypothetical protein ACNS62_20365 [Candidatus Cyclobacteriaceae bacterium M3_2C_046]